MKINDVRISIASIEVVQRYKKGNEQLQQKNKKKKQNKSNPSFESILDILI